MMKKLFRFMFVAVVLMVGSAFAEITPSKPQKGDGTIGNPFEITSAAELYWLAEVVNGGKCSEYGGGNCSAELTTDLTVNSNLLGMNNENVNAKTGEYTGGAPANVWTPIGTKDNQYTGTFDGKGNTVSGLYFNDGEANDVGLFGYISPGATVQNVGVIDSYIRGKDYVGGVVGEMDNGGILDVYNTGSVSGTGDWVGGVVGYNNDGSIINVYNTGSVSGNGDVGGVVGFKQYGTILDVYNTGSVSGKQEVGGVVGYNYGTIGNVYNTGSVSGTGDYVGGVVGYNYGTIGNVYNTGSVSGTGDWVGGVVGINEGGTISKVYNTGSVSGKQKVGGVVGCSFGTISNVYNTGTVSGNDFVGGVVGDNYGTISNAYNTGSVSGEYNVGGVVGATAGNKVNKAYYDEQTCNNCNSYGTGKTLAELATLTIGSKADDGADFPLLKGETESPWAKSIYYDKATGKLTLSYPYLKNFSDAQHKETIQFVTLKNNVIQISSTDDLKNFAKLVNEYHITDVDAELTTNLSVNSNLLGKNNANVNAETGEYKGCAPANVWTPIGTKDNQYTGTFDGKGYTVSGLYLNDHLKHDVGLFGFVKGGTIQNVGVVDSYFYGDYDIGGVVGNLDGGKVVNCYNNGVVRAISKNVGGVVAYDKNGKISDSYNIGVVYGAKDYVGGVAGYVEGDTITNCYNTGAIDGPSYEIGGVVGFVKNGGVTNSYNTGSVNGIGTVGGVVGELDESLASNVYNTAEVSGKKDDAVGGLAGYVDEGEVSNGYNIGPVKGVSFVGGIAGGSSESIIKNVYNSASVTGDESFGAVVGYCRSGKIGNAYYNTDLFNERAVTDSESVAIVGDIAGKTAAQLIAGTSVTLDETAWAVGAKGENAKQDTLFYPYLKVFGSHLYVLGDVKKYTVTVAANDKAMGSVTGAGEYEYGSEVEISATANEGYKFTDWQDDVKDAKRTLTVTKDETFTANFEEIPSSSSEIASSSSEAESSSSEVASSSSEDESSSSSSAKSKSSSSSAKAKSSSSKGKDALVAAAQVPQFSVTVSGRMLSVVGIRPNTNVEVFDMQGNRVKTEVVTSANFSFALPSAGTYIVKNGYIAKRVNVR